MSNNKEERDLNQGLNSYLGSEKPKQVEECTTEECLIKRDKSIVERVNKKIILY